VKVEVEGRVKAAFLMVSGRMVTRQLDNVSKLLLSKEGPSR